MRADDINDRFVLDRLPPRATWPDRPVAALRPEVRADHVNAGVWLMDRIDLWAQNGRTAFLMDGHPVGYDAVARRVATFSSALCFSGAMPGNRVLLRLTNGPDMAAALIACWLTGTVAVATPPLLRSTELARVLETCTPNFAIVEPGLADDLTVAMADTGIAPAMVDPDTDTPNTQGALAQTMADDPALILFTSGTTGHPKAAVHDHRAVLATATLYADDLLHPVAEDVFAGTPPMAFAYGLAGLMLFPLSVGAATLIPTGRGVRGLAEAMADTPPTVCFTAPTGYRRMVGDLPNRAIDRLRFAVSAGEPLSASVAERWADRTGSTPIDVLGTTEMLSMVLTSDPGSRTLRPVNGYTVRLAEPDRAMEVGAGPVGLLEVCGPTGCRYLDAPSAQADYVIDGWNRTGDVLRSADANRYAYVARSDDLILTRGYTVSGPEIEAIVNEHPAVRESAVVGIDDGDGGVVLKALIVADSPFVADETMIPEIQAFVKDRLAAWKVPRAVVFIDRLPRTATGKLRRGFLRDL